MKRGDNKVIGYFAYTSPTEVVCTGEACIIAGTRRAIESYLLEIDPDGQAKQTIKKTTFAEIKQGLTLGAAYGFDKGAYRRFYPLARQAGLGVLPAEFEKHEATGERYLIVQLAALDRQT